MFAKYASTAFLAALGLGLAAGPQVQAQPQYDDTVGGVTVYGQFGPVRDPTTGQWVRPDVVQVRVSLADLDLSSDYGARVAHARINRAAREACARVEAAYPQDVDYGRGCYARAVRDGMFQVEDQLGYRIAWR